MSDQGIMSIEQLKAALRKVCRPLLPDPDGEPGSRPHYKGEWVEQVLKCNEQYLDEYLSKCKLADSLRDMMKVTVNQGQMALHMSRLLTERREIVGPDRDPDGE